MKKLIVCGQTAGADRAAADSDFIPQVPVAPGVAAGRIKHLNITMKHFFPSPSQAQRQQGLPRAGGEGSAPAQSLCWVRIRGRKCFMARSRCHCHRNCSGHGQQGFVTSLARKDGKSFPRCLAKQKLHVKTAPLPARGLSSHLSQLLE